MLCPNCGAKVMMLRIRNIGQWQCGWCGQSGYVVFRPVPDDEEDPPIEAKEPGSEE